MYESTQKTFTLQKKRNVLV